MRVILHALLCTVLIIIAMPILVLITGIYLWWSLLVESYDDIIIEIHAFKQRKRESEIKNTIQNAIKHWLKPEDCGVVTIHYEVEKTTVSIEWSDGVSIFDCDKVLALIKDKQKISKDDLIDYCSV